MKPSRGQTQTRDWWVSLCGFFPAGFDGAFLSVFLEKQIWWCQAQTQTQTQTQAQAQARG